MLFKREAIDAVALDLGLASRGMLSNWIRSYKENGYNVVIKQPGRRTHEQEKTERIRAAQARKRRAVSLEFKAYSRKRIFKKLDALVQKRKSPPKQK
ncbi:hypothetical protein [Lactobacillus hominis]|uniref:hypothetical protein n=1 Tax=Lactobacillus hominis TaxID=1203033 RepID=UPI003F4D433D